MPVTATYIGIPERHMWITEDYTYYGDVAKESDAYYMNEDTYVTIIGWMYYPDVPSKYKIEGAPRFWEDTTPRTPITLEDLNDD